MPLSPSPNPPAIMPAPLRVLHLEDDPVDRELVRLALVHDGTAYDFVHAANEAEFSAALSHEKFALILSDFALPGYDGMSALVLAHAKCPQVPFLFVSGTIGEELAIESLRSGATDYVLKDRLERLLPAVQRALSEARERTKSAAAETALRHSEERFREMAETIRDVFWITSPDGLHVRYVSPAYEQLYGRPIPPHYSQSTLLVDVIVEEDRARALTALARLQTGQECRVEYRINWPDGTVRWLEHRGYPVRNRPGKITHAVGVLTDITDRRLLEAQLLQAQKMEAVGQLAGGLAHDFNNVLTIVIGYSRLLLDRGTMPTDSIKPLTEIFTAGNRAANLTRQLLVFSCQQSVTRQALDLNKVTGAIAEMLRRLIGEHITLDLSLSSSPCVAEADAGMIEQVLMNLAVNARDAMPAGGTLTVATEHLAITDAASHGHPGARAGDFVGLTVRDTGTGIAPENLRRIFEPFFTTKEIGKGTGLGLAMVFGIVRQHDGWIEVESTVGAGTCFRILLPAVPAAAPVTVQHPSKSAAPNGGGETVLLVEDEPAVREFAVAVLRSHGYRVLQAASGVDALEVWKWHGPKIALLFTDLVMPDGLDGVELAALLRKDKPALKVVLTSGYANETIGEEFHAPSDVHFVRKPYNPKVLAQAVRDALDDNFNR